MAVTEATAKPSSVCLPFYLVPGMDTSSLAYQKATTLLAHKTYSVQVIDIPDPCLPAEEFGAYFTLIFPLYFSLFIFR